LLLPTKTNTWQVCRADTVIVRRRHAYHRVAKFVRLNR
jgi:hypothetical protein